jgi:hypothetical protein
MANEILMVATCDVTKGVELLVMHYHLIVQGEPSYKKH